MDKEDREINRERKWQVTEREKRTCHRDKRRLWEVIRAKRFPEARDKEE